MSGMDEWQRRENERLQKLVVSAFPPPKSPAEEFEEMDRHNRQAIFVLLGLSAMIWGGIVVAAVIYR